MRPSIKEIAKTCGVSTQAVSYALNNSGRLSSETRERIVEAARVLGYRRNPVADTMKSRRFGSVAFIRSSDLSRGWVPEGILTALHDELAQHDLSLSLVRLNDEQVEDEETLPRLMHRWAYDGLFMTELLNSPSDLTDLMEQHRLPAVWLNVKRTHDAVYPDDEGESYRGTRLLIEHGHQRIDYFSSYFAGGPEHYSVGARSDGYKRAMREAGLKPRIIPYPAIYGFPGKPASIQPAIDWLTRPDRPTAIFSYNEAGMLLTYSAALSLGLKVPQELSLLSFETQVLAGVLAMNHIWFPAREIAAAAVEMLLHKMEAPSRSFPSVKVSSTFFEGDSIAPPPNLNRPKTKRAGKRIS